MSDPDLADGVTDDQIDAALGRGLAAGGALFGALAQQMPESGTP